MYKIVYYMKPSGKYPVEEFINSLSVKEQAKIDAALLKLSELGPEVRMPLVKKISAKLWELRVEYSSNQFRIFHFYCEYRKIVLLDGIKKKTQKLKQSDIKKAEVMMKEYLGNNK